MRDIEPHTPNEKTFLVNGLFHFVSRTGRFLRAAWQSQNGFRQVGGANDPSAEAPQEMDASSPHVSHPDRVFGLATTLSTHPTARFQIHTKPSAENLTGTISIGRNVYFGKEVELATVNSISIGEETSFQNYCIVSGDVSIGAHCLFSLFVFVGSRNHEFRAKPEWLIRDQDTWVFESPDIAAEVVSRPVTIEDDCWLGWGSVITPGVYIGRGAIIGANSVVTKDVAPYEIHGGVPNARIGKRLEFMPPSTISAMEDSSFPYFYRGFSLKRDIVKLTRKAGVVEAGPGACFVLQGAPGKEVRFSGMRSDPEGTLQLAVRINGVNCGHQTIGEGAFRIQMRIPTEQHAASQKVPAVLRQHTYVELDEVSQGGQSLTTRSGISRYGLSSASLLP
jgi:acetyltransferase-like isoleucine patch superfamily enzyme